MALFDEGFWQNLKDIVVAAIEFFRGNIFWLMTIMVVIVIITVIQQIILILLSGAL